MFFARWAKRNHEAIQACRNVYNRLIVISAKAGIQCLSTSKALERRTKDGNTAEG